MSDEDRQQTRSRTGTEVRRRDALVGVRLTQCEMAKVKEVAASQGTSPGSVLREAFFRIDAAD